MIIVHRGDGKKAINSIRAKIILVVCPSSIYSMRKQGTGKEKRTTDPKTQENNQN